MDTIRVSSRLAEWAARPRNITGYKTQTAEAEQDQPGGRRPEPGERLDERAKPDVPDSEVVEIVPGRLARPVPSSDVDIPSGGQ